MVDGELFKEQDPARRRGLWVEVWVVLLLAVLPDIANSILSHVVPLPPQDIALDEWSMIDRSVRIAAAVLFIMWRSGEGWSSFGLTKVKLRDPFFGLMLWFACWAALLLVYSGGLTYGFRAVPVDTGMFEVPETTFEWGMVGLGSICNGFTEEIATVGLLLTRLERLTGRSVLPVLVVSLLTAAYHVYGGVDHVLNAFIGTLLGAAWFAATRRLWVPIFAHMFADFLPFVLWA